MTAEDEARLRQDLSDEILLRAFERDVPFRDEDLVKDEFRLPVISCPFYNNLPIH